MTELPPLEQSDFPRFFGDLWSSVDDEQPQPFPWQVELVSQLAEQRRWPDLCDLPTGSGKTSLLEIAIFLQALEADVKPAERWAPRRVVLVVDRRVVVDQAHDRGQYIRQRLDESGGGPLASCAARLRHLFGGEARDPPLLTSVLRGGIVRDESWARRPDVPALISSTVDQVGSRLLFRGYGVGPAMRPLHAGLLANDCLWLLDEVHLARPFAQTLKAVRRHRTSSSSSAKALGPDRWHVVELSATPVEPSGSRFPATPVEPGSHPVLARRLTARKPARLEVIDSDAESAFVKRCATEAAGLVEKAARTVAVVVNRVASARATAAAIVSRSAELEADVLLLTGRMRPFDRDALVARQRDRLRTGRPRSPDDRILIVVATQCIEAGADFDFDGMVTECASLDALRQRFGRVDRDGRLSEAGQPAQSVIVVRNSDIKTKAEDPVYGIALRETWAWLQAQKSVDFGITTLASPTETELERLTPPSLRAPTLLPAHLDAWVQTSPAPAVEPDVAYWLHGLREPEAEVQVIWRADITETLLEAPEAALARVQACPPATGEALTLSIGAARRWLQGEDPADLSDAGGAQLAADDEVASGGSKLAVRWAGRESSVIRAPDLKPGDSIVVPATRGGIERGSWNPSLSEPSPVSDIAFETIAGQRKLAVFRLIPQVLPDLPLIELDAFETASASEQRQLVRSWVGEQELDVDLATRRAKAELVLGPGELDDAILPSLVITVPIAAPTRHLPLEVEADRDAASFVGAAKAQLDRHLEQVGALAGVFAERAGLSRELVDDLRVAGRLHDLGKADERFQLWLHGGDEVALAAADAPLAKSSTPDFDRARREEARKRSGYPAGTRHETMSVAMCEARDSRVETPHDWDLVLHLIASHHGVSRPFAPHVPDPDPRTVAFRIGDVELSGPSDHGLARVDSGVAARFWRTVSRYGWFGLATLETMLRLADHRQSEREGNA